MRLLIASEGPNDIGAEGADGDGEARRGAVRVLVRRFLERELTRRLDDWEVECRFLPRLNTARGLDEKVRRLLRDAAADGLREIVVVLDRDGDTERLSTMRKGVELAHADDAGTLELRTAIGVAIETVEAWLLADVGALNAALAPAPLQEEHPQPEERYTGRPGTDTHPKSVFRNVVRTATTNKDRAYDAVAELTKLNVLEQRCSRGFAPFAADLRRLPGI